MDKQEKIKNIKQKIMDDPEFKEELSDEKMKLLISRYLLENDISSTFVLKERKKLGKEIFDSLRNFDILQDLLEDEEVTEIMVNGVNDIFIEKKGKLEKSSLQFYTRENLLDVINRIAASCNRTVNETSPIADARLMSGERVNIVLKPIALNGPILTIRRFPKTPMTMERLVEYEAINQEAASFLNKAVKAKYNILISGGTGSGKTSFLNALSEFIPKDERIITIEDSAELQIKGIENIVRLETRSSVIEGTKEITIRELIRTSLRMRPDRIIVGEVRGAEAVDMVGSAMNCGHDGSMSTIHANSAADVFSRLENMYLMGAYLPIAAIRRQIASGIDLIIHLGRMRDKSRKVLEITEVLGMEKEEIMINPIYRFFLTSEGEDKKVKGEWRSVGELHHREKMERQGIIY